MIERLRGELRVLTPGLAVVEAAGVGFAVVIGLRGYGALRELPTGAGVELLIELTWSEKNGPALYGFTQESDRRLFRLLLGGSGVGPKLALAAVSTLEPAEVCSALVDADTALLSRVPGIGRKRAEKLSLELREGAAELLTALGAVEVTPARSDALAALVSLGYPRPAAAEAVSNAEKELGEGAEIQALIARALAELRH